MTEGKGGGAQERGTVGKCDAVACETLPLRDMRGQRTKTNDRQTNVETSSPCCSLPPSLPPSPVPVPCHCLHSLRTAPARSHTLLTGVRQAARTKVHSPAWNAPCSGQLIIILARREVNATLLEAAWAEHCESNKEETRQPAGREREREFMAAG